MKKIKMTLSDSISIEEGCNLYLNLCKARNYSPYTIKHYDNPAIPTHPAHCTFGYPHQVTPK